MGAECSTLKSIESLNSTLETIEKKLFTIEDMYIHHEMSMSQDNNIFISGSPILTNPKVRVVVGPIVGLLTTTSIRILLEIDHDAEITSHVFDTEETYMNNRFKFKQTLFLKANQPTILTLTQLEPNHHYHIYFGGLFVEDIYQRYVSIHTPMVSGENIDYICIHDGQLNKLSTNNSYLWNDLQEEFENNHSRNMSNTTNTMIKPCKYLISTGNLWSFEQDILLLVQQLLGLIDSPELDIIQLQHLIDQIEKQVKLSYQQLLTHKIMQLIGQQCVLIALPSTQETCHALFQQIFDIIIQKQQQLLQQQQSNTQQQYQSLFGEQNQEAIQTLQLKHTEQHFQFNELHQMVFELVGRILRRNYWLYLRQLWDSKIYVTYEEDLMKETLLRKILYTKKNILIKKQLLINETQAMENILQQFSGKHPAFVYIQNAKKKLETEIDISEKNIQEMALKCGDLIVNQQEIHFFHQLTISSQHILLLLDLNWSFLANDGTLQRSINQEIKIENEAYSNLLIELETTQTMDLTGIVLVASSPLIAKDILYSKQHQDILQLFTQHSSQISYSVHDILKTYQSMLINKLDLRKLLISLAKWQQANRKRSMIVITGNSSSYCSHLGTYEPFVQSSQPSNSIQLNKQNSKKQLKQSQEIEEEALDIWQPEECKLMVLQLGSMLLPTISIWERLSLLFQTKSISKHEFYDDFLTFKYLIAFNQIYNIHSYWHVSFVSEASPIIDSTSDSGVRAGSKAAFLSTIHQHEKKGVFLSNFLITQVHYRSIICILEITDNQLIEIACIDVLTGDEYVVTKYLQAYSSQTIEFVGLLPNHQYDIVILNGLFLSQEYHLLPNLFATTLRKLLGKCTTLKTFSSPSTSSTVDELNIERIALFGPLQFEANLSKTTLNYPFFQKLLQSYSQPWHGIHHSIHFTSLGIHPTQLSSILLQLSTIQPSFSSQLSSLSSLSSSNEQQLQQIEQELYEIIQINIVHNTFFRQLITKGEHMFYSYPFYELLQEYQIESISELTQSFTPLQIELLLTLFTNIHHKLFHSQPIPSSLSNNYTFISNHTLSFPLIINTPIQHESINYPGNHLLPIHICYQLQEILTNAKSTIKNILIISPIPIVLYSMDSEYNYDLQSSQSFKTLRKFSNQDIFQLINCLFHWQKVHQQEINVVFICSSQYKLQTKIEFVCRDLNHNNNNNDNNMLNKLQITQITNGYFGYQNPQQPTFPMQGKLVFSDSNYELNYEHQDLMLQETMNSSSITSSSSIPLLTLNNQTKEIKIEEINMDNIDELIPNGFSQHVNEDDKQYLIYNQLIQLFDDCKQNNFSFKQLNGINDQALYEITSVIEMIMTYESKLLQDIFHLFDQKTSEINLFGYEGINMFKYKLLHMIYLFITKASSSFQSFLQYPTTFMFDFIWEKYSECLFLDSFHANHINSDQFMISLMTSNIDLFINCLKLCLIFQLISEYLYSKPLN